MSEPKEALQDCRYSLKNHLVTVDRERRAVRMLVHEIPGKLKCEWDPKARAIVDTWTDYNVTLDEFREAVLVKGLSYSAMNGGRAWIVDSSQATGAFSQEIQSFIVSDIFPAFQKKGVKYFMTITSETAITKMTVSQYASKAGPCGLQLVQGRSASGAKEWLLKNAA